MISAGIDLGSRTVKLVVLGEDGIIASNVADTGYDPMQTVRELLRGTAYDRILATGYSRNLFEIEFDSPTVTEIKAHAAGVGYLFAGKAEVGTILDIGGQDSKVISLHKSGRVLKFEMNDRCAAGTGKFLEMMAATLGFGIEAFGLEASRAANELAISSMCAVFAESEVTSLLARGENRRDISYALHRSIARRASGMLKRLLDERALVFTGGVARNTFLQRLIADRLGRELLVPDAPQMTGALGAAVLAGE